MSKCRSHNIVHAHVLFLRNISPHLLNNIYFVFTPHLLSVSIRTLELIISHRIHEVSFCAREDDDGQKEGDAHKDGTVEESTPI